MWSLSKANTKAAEAAGPISLSVFQSVNTALLLTTFERSSQVKEFLLPLLILSDSSTDAGTNPAKEKCVQMSPDEKSNVWISVLVFSCSTTWMKHSCCYHLVWLQGSVKAFVSSKESCMTRHNLKASHKGRLPPWSTWVSWPKRNRKPSWLCWKEMLS